jgi:hypothetical protein
VSGNYGIFSRIWNIAVNAKTTKRGSIHTFKRTLKSWKARRKSADAISLAFKAVISSIKAKTLAETLLDIVTIIVAVVVVMDEIIALF